MGSPPETYQVTAIGWLYAFLIGAVPIALTPRVSSPILITMCASHDAVALTSLVGPYTGSDCDIHSGNDQNFTGNYVLFQLSYLLLLLTIYTLALVNLATRKLG